MGPSLIVESRTHSASTAKSGTSTAVVQPPPKAPPKAIAPIFATGSKGKRTNVLQSSSSPSVGLSSPSPSLKRSADESPELVRKRFKTTVENMHSAAPLAERLRPSSLEEFVGQDHLTAPDSLLMGLLQRNSMGSLIFWGPPGCGKTTLARLLAKRADATFKELSATGSGVNDVRAVFEEAKGQLVLTGRRTILFLDEVHRFNKAQQDIFLPYLEQGYIQLIGATTENPSFKLNSALLSRCRVFVLEKLTDQDIKEIVTRAVVRASSSEDAISECSPSSQAPSSSPSYIPLSQDSIATLPEPSSEKATSSLNNQFPSYPQLTDRVLTSLVSLSTGDARTALSLLELVFSSSKESKEGSLIESLRRSVSASYDRTGESHYDMISALHKSVRGSHGNAAMYWLARMLSGGEDPLYIARRMVVCASEDIGLADNHALPLAMATLQACQVIGMPECRINLAHLVAYLSEAPKSTRAYEAYNRAEEAAKLDLTIPVPLGVRNAPTKLMKELGYARGYSYNPDYAHPVHNDYLPIQFKDDIFLRKAGDMTGKVWDEDLLRRWEYEDNGRKDWPGRKTLHQDDN